MYALSNFLSTTTHDTNCFILAFLSIILISFSTVWIHLFYFKIKEKVVKPGIIFPLTSDIEKLFVSVLLLSLTIFIVFLTVLNFCVTYLKL